MLNVSANGGAFNDGLCEGKEATKLRYKSRERKGGRGTAWAKMKWGREDE